MVLNLKRVISPTECSSGSIFSQMKHGDIEFHERSGAILNALSNEGLQIARSNQWTGLVIQISAAGCPESGNPAKVCCLLKSTHPTPEIDEPSATLLDAANDLQELFHSVGTPFLEATIDWVEGETPGTVRRRCSYRYE